MLLHNASFTGHCFVVVACCCCCCCCWWWWRCVLRCVLSLTEPVPVVSRRWSGRWAEEIAAAASAGPRYVEITQREMLNLRLLLLILLPQLLLLPCPVVGALYMFCCNLHFQLRNSTYCAPSDKPWCSTGDTSEVIAPDAVLNFLLLYTASQLQSPAHCTLDKEHWYSTKHGE